MGEVLATEEYKLFVWSIVLVSGWLHFSKF